MSRVSDGESRKERKKGGRLCRASWAAVRTWAFAWSEVKPRVICELRRDRADLGVNRALAAGWEGTVRGEDGSRAPREEPRPWFR